jgi:hypothetical protein
LYVQGLAGWRGIKKEKAVKTVFAKIIGSPCFQGEGGAREVETSGFHDALVYFKAGIQSGKGDDIPGGGRALGQQG